MAFTPAVAAEVVVRDFLAAQFNGSNGLPTARVVTETPANLATVVPLIRVEVVVGAPHVYVLDSVLVDIECWHTNRDQARTLAQQVRTVMEMHAPGTHQDGAYIASVTSSTPHWAHYDDITVRRFIAMYHVDIRSVPTP